MKIEIWSDVMCPFCYMGKKQLEKALDRFSGNGNVEIVWKSFELNPDIKHKPNYSIQQYLSEITGMDIETVKHMNQKLKVQGEELGIEFNFETAQVSNSRKAHMLIHIAQKQNKATDFKENLFHSYFTLGENVEDEAILIRLAKEVGVDLSSYTNPFEDKTILDEVLLDQYQAQQVGARGVPFFVFNEAHSLSGAHGEETILKVLETVKIKSGE